MNTTLRTLINKALADADSLVKEGSAKVAEVKQTDPTNEVEKLASALEYISVNLGAIERTPEEKMAEFEVFLNKIGALEGMDGGIPQGFAPTPLSPGAPENVVPNDLSKVDPTMGQRQVAPIAASHQPVPPSGEMPVRPGDPPTANLADDAARLAFGAPSKTASLNKEAGRDGGLGAKIVMGVADGAGKVVDGVKNMSLGKKVMLGAAGGMAAGGAAGNWKAKRDSEAVGLEGKDKSNARLAGTVGGAVDTPFRGAIAAGGGALMGAGRALSKNPGAVKFTDQGVKVTPELISAGKRMGLKGALIGGSLGVLGAGLHAGHESAKQVLFNREKARVKAEKNAELEDPTKEAGLAEIGARAKDLAVGMKTRTMDGVANLSTAAKMRSADPAKAKAMAMTGLKQVAPAAGAIAAVPVAASMMGSKKHAGLERLFAAIKTASNVDNPADTGPMTEDPPQTSPDPIGDPIGGRANVPIAQSAETMINTSPKMIADSNKAQMLQYISEDGQDGTLNMLEATKMAAAKNKVMSVLNGKTEEKKVASVQTPDPMARIKESLASLVSSVED